MKKTNISISCATQENPKSFVNIIIYLLMILVPIALYRVYLQVGYIPLDIIAFKDALILPVNILDVLLLGLFSLNIKFIFNDLKLNSLHNVLCSLALVILIFFCNIWLNGGFDTLTFDEFTSVLKSKAGFFQFLGLAGLFEGIYIIPNNIIKAIKQQLYVCMVTGEGTGGVDTTTGTKTVTGKAPEGIAKNSPKSKSEFKSFPTSTSNNSISSSVSYTSADLALAADLDKKNFSNVVDNDTIKATELYNKKVDELTKAKAELAKYKKTDKIDIGLKIEEDKPF